jgi:D-apiose dehydrogenase
MPSAPSDRPLRGAILGAGYFAGFHADGWARVPGVEIAAVADPVPGRAREFAQRWGIPRAYASANPLLTEEGLDFVDVATRPDTHLPLTRLAAERGVHVICQKPMAPTWEDCRRMLDVCRDAGVRLIIHENWRWQPWYREMRRLVDEGRLGRLFHIGFTMRTGDGRGPEPYPVQPYFRAMERFLLQETVVHFLDTFRFLGGEIETVACRTARINPVIAGEDYAVVQVGFRSGAAGLIDANRISGPETPPLAFGTMRLEGERASLRLTEDGRLWLDDYAGAEVEHVFPTSDLGYKGDSVRAAQEHYAQCLRSGEPAESEGEEYLKTVAAVFACYRSAETGRVTAAGIEAVDRELAGS